MKPRNNVPPPIRRWRAKAPRTGTCRACGCTDDNACEGGCSWVDSTYTLCSVCAPWGRERILAANRASTVPVLLLVGCGLKKESSKRPAWELYKGPLYRSTLAYARATGEPWAILSAKHGVVTGDTVLKPYDARVEQLRGKSLLDWRDNVVDGLHELLPQGGQVVVLAGKEYAKPWAQMARSAGYEVLEPLANLTPTNRRIAWLDERPHNLFTLPTRRTTR